MSVAAGVPARAVHRPTEPLVRKTVTLPVLYVEQLAAFGAGNLSDGIRLLAETAYTRSGQPWLRTDASRHHPSRKDDLASGR